MSLESTPKCKIKDHQEINIEKILDDVIRETDTLFSALGEISRLRLMDLTVFQNLLMKLANLCL